VDGCQAEQHEFKYYQSNRITMNPQVISTKISNTECRSKNVSE